MAGKNITERINAMESKKKQMESHLASLKARSKAEERKKDTRRKILVGSYFIKKFNDSESMDDLRTLMNGYLTDRRDRELFGLYDNCI